MEYGEFQRILTAFADKPAHVDVEHGELIVEIRDDIIEAKIFMRNAALVVEEDGVRQSATDWIINRIARLPILADRILAYVAEEPYFIEPAGELLKRVEDSPDDINGNSVEEVTPEILEVLDQRPAGTSTGLYITSDAGEGKTTLIHYLARYQASQYKRKETDWLLVPIALGGRSFLRFDDVIIGTLVNRLRFPFLYYDAFVWLVRMGVIVPALDGFEEMFVEGQAGDAVSALGNLMQLLDSQGTILIAARSAYFEYKSLQAQAPLFDSIRDQWTDFARIKLFKWDRDRFIRYANMQKVDGKALFEDVAEKLRNESHPLLTRAVLAKRLIEVASEGADRENLIKSINRNGKHYFDRLVESIIAREARQKWIDRSGEAAHPLLTERQHGELLAEIALEMWVSETAVLKSDVFDSLVDLYAESCSLDTHVTNQIRDRIRQHALIAAANDIPNAFRFNHEEFYHYFLGEAVARMITGADATDIRRAFRIARFPDLTLEVAARGIREHTHTPSRIVDLLNETCATEPRASFVKENSGDLAIRLIDAGNLGEVAVRGMSFTVDSLRGRTIENITFHHCQFQRTALAQSKIRNCSFEGCQFTQVDLSEVTEIVGSRLYNCEVLSVVRSPDETALYAPPKIEKVLEQGGFQVITSVHHAEEDSIQELQELQEKELVLTESMCRAFFRSTGVNENTFRQRFGSDAPLFFEKVLPCLKDHGVVKEVPYKGAGQQLRYRLAVSLRDVQKSIAQADGSFEKFLKGMDALS